MDDDALRAAVDDASARLGREPLWHASLGSKELFHSNLLGWALETWADRGRHVLGLSGDAAVGGVRREYLDLDLVVEFADGEVLVVENKAFALPDEAQLRRYAESPKGSPAAPGWFCSASPTQGGATASW